MAGQRAKASTAYASALTCLIAGAALLAEDCWERRHELIFALELERAECEFLTGALAEAEQRLAVLQPAPRPRGTRHRRVLARGSIHHPRPERAAPLPSVSTISGTWASTGRRTRRKRKRDSEYERIWSQLGSRTIEALIELPLMSDPASLATMDVLTKIIVPALYHRCEPASPRHLPRGESQPRTWQL